MSIDGSIDRKWADGEHRFRLGLGQLRELQDKRAISPMTMLGRMAQHGWMIDDVIEVLRLGLIGAGMPPAEALKLVERYIDPPRTPLLPTVRVALEVLSAAIVGPDDDEVGNDDPEAAKTETQSSPSPGSTGPALQ